MNREAIMEILLSTCTTEAQREYIREMDKQLNREWHIYKLIMREARK